MSRRSIYDERVDSQNYFGSRDVLDQSAQGTETANDEVTDRSPGAGKSIGAKPYEAVDYSKNLYGNSYNEYLGKGDAGNSEETLVKGKPGKVKYSGGKNGNSSSSGNGGGGNCPCAEEKKKQTQTGADIKAKAQQAATTGASGGGSTTAGGGSGSSGSAGATSTSGSAGCDCEHEDSVVNPSNEIKKDDTTQKKDITGMPQRKDIIFPLNWNVNQGYNPCKPGALSEKTKMIIYIYQSKDAIKSGYLKNEDMKAIRKEIIRIYKINGLNLDVRLIDNKNGEGDELFDKWANKELPINQGVFELSWNTRFEPQGPGGTNAWFNTPSPIFTYDIKRYHEKQNQPSPFNASDSKINQISTGVAHEILHYYLAAVESYFRLKSNGMMAWDKILSQESEGHEDNIKPHLNTSIISPYKILTDDDKRILKDQIVAIRTLLRGLAMSPCDFFMGSPFFKSKLVANMLLEMMTIQKNENRYNEN